MTQTLPASVLELKMVLEKSENLKDLLSAMPSSLKPKTQNILQYSISGLKSGRPLHNVMIMMAGQSGTGKSTTINRLFEDDTLCNVSATRSETSSVVEYTKKLCVNDVNPAITAEIKFVDMPGSLDTDSTRESLNLAQIQNYRKNNQALRKRGTPTAMMIMPIKIRSDVYPNLVLFVVNSGDKRMEGPDSSLSKALKILKSADLVDVKMNNLVVVATHAMSLGSSKKKFTEKTALVKSTIQKAVQNIFKIPEITVVFVENEPDDFDLEKDDDSDFYKLPDGELSHSNLILAMYDIFNASKDKLGLLLTSWYFGSNCPDKYVKPTVKEVPCNEHEVDIDISEAEKSLHELNIKTANSDVIIPIYNFSSLGYAYCPVTESFKSHYVFKKHQLQVLKIGNSKFQIPQFVNSHVGKSTNFRRLCYENKMGYEGYKATQYGLELDAKLVVGVSSRGKWIKGSATCNRESVFSVLNEVRLASLQIDSPGQFISEELINALQALPSSYKEEPEGFNDFFAKWGTHFSWKQFIGGSIKLDCTVQTADFNQNTETTIEAKAGLLFSSLGHSVGSEAQRDSAYKALEGVGLSNESVIIAGGNPPMVLSMRDITPAMFQEWKDSVESDPKELEHSFMLYPYYNLEYCTNSNALREATLDYLCQNTKTTIAQKIAKKRDEIAKKGQEDAKSTGGGGSCFPPSTVVSTAAGPKLISSINNEDMLLTVKSLHGGNYNIEQTQLCTFLHWEPNKIALFLNMKFSNGKTLTVTGEHLLLAYEGVNLRPRRASKFVIGDRIVFIDEARSITTPSLISTHYDEHVGVFSPLSASGTFLANGFLVTSYAEVEGFRMAHAAMAPLITWCQLKKIANTHKNQLIEQENHGIHGYAKFLMFIRKHIDNLYDLLN